MSKVLCLACSSYSGSTLLTAMLNQHPKIATVGYMVGWESDPANLIRCSCGERLDGCAFFQSIRDSLHSKGLPFEFHRFGTQYSFSRNARLDQILTRNIPGLHSTRLESIRDAVVHRIPAIARKLALAHRINRAFVEAALAYKGAEVFVDNQAGGGYRLRFLRRAPGLDVRAVHLIRDVRGVVLSNMKKRGWTSKTAARVWLDQQCDLLRITTEDAPVMRVHYEDLVAAPDDVLAAIHRFAGIEPRRFSGDLGAVEHHILGNAMRLSLSKIVPDTKWRSELSERERKAINSVLTAFLRRHPQHPVGEIVERYLSD